MKSIRARIGVWYALSATLTMAVLFIFGYQLLQSYILRDLDLLNHAEFEQIRQQLGHDYKILTPTMVDQRIRETTNSASVLFYINIDKPPHDMLFYSNNLDGRPIPDVPHKHIYNAIVPGIGEMRVAEFIMRPFDITIATPSRQMQQVMRAYVEVCIALLAAMLLVSGLIGIGVGQLILRPVRLIGETANRINSDNLSERIVTPGVKDEIFDLARLLNQMFDRLEDSFAQVRRFSADVSHELKTPLSLIRLHAEKLLTDGNLRHHQEEALLEQIDELTRMNQIIDDLLFISRAEADGVKLRLSPENPAGFLQSIEPDLRVLAEDRGMCLVFSHEGEGIVAIETKWLRQVIFNLLTNALRVSPPGGRIEIRSVIDGNAWSVSVEDQGPGLSDDQREHAFDRFVRFNVPAVEYRGAGLGLAICRSIVGLHKGRIYARRGSDGTGLRVTFEMPVFVASNEATTVGGD
ncbi:MAG: ATP-binding protein [Rhodanobacteraceae bacterium]